MAQKPPEAPMVLKEVLVALLNSAIIVGYGPPWLSYSKSPQAPQFLFWHVYCQTTCLLGMLLSL